MSICYFYTSTPTDQEASPAEAPLGLPASLSFSTDTRYPKHPRGLTPNRGLRRTARCFQWLGPLGPRLGKTRPCLQAETETGLPNLLPARGMFLEPGAQLSVHHQ